MTCRLIFSLDFPKYFLQRNQKMAKTMYKYSVVLVTNEDINI